MELKQALDELSKMIKDEIIRRLHSPIGINPRTGSNTLIGSDLEKSIDAKPTSDEKIVFEIASYWEHVVRGWKRTHNYPGTISQFIYNINEWVRKKNIRFGNIPQSAIVWVLYRKMFVEGREIKPRPFINYDENGDISKMLPFLDDMIDKWVSSIYDDALNEIDKYFNT